MKKTVSILLCMVMVLSMGAVAFADGEMLTTTLLTAPTLIAPNPEPLDILIAPAPGTGSLVIAPAPEDILVAPAGMTEAEMKEALAGFTDYKEGEWYVEGLAFCVKNKLMDGTGEKTISPAKNITCKEVVEMLNKLAGQLVAADGKSFTDIATDKEITREELLAMIFKFKEYVLEAKGENTGILYPNLALTYADADKISDEAKSAFRWATAEGIIKGKPGNIADPKAVASRAEVAVIFQRLGMVPDELLSE